MKKGRGKNDEMYIVTVVPIKKGMGKEHLSYFSSKAYDAGTVVNVPLRSSYSPALVTSIKNVKDMKSELRAADFSLKKIRPQNASAIFHPQCIEIAHEASDYFATTTGALLETLIPKAIIKNLDEVSQDKNLISGETKSGSCESLILQAGQKERHMQFKSIVREEFARNQSVFFLVPTQNDAERIRAAIERGIEEYMYVLHGKLSAKKMRDVWKKASSEKHPIAVIATGSFLSLPRNDFGTFVIENESSSLYKIQKRPYTDMRWIAENLACALGARCVLSDTILRTETIWRYKEGEFLDIYPPKFRYADHIASHVIDMNDMRITHRNSIDGLALISDHAQALFDHIENKGGKVFVFAARTGLRPITLCGDCKEPLVCENCKYPLVLHSKKNPRTKKDEPIYICRICSHTRSSKATCPHCGSWKLEALGIGIDLVEKVLKKGYENIPLFVLDSTRIKKRSDAKTIIQEFEKSPSGILLSTQMGLPYLKENVDYSVVISLDSLLAIPDLSIAERVFSLITEIKHATKKTFLLQTRRAESDLLHWAVMGNITSLYRSEIQDRETFSYPPFSILIKISTTGSFEDMRQSFTDVYKKIKKYKPEFYPSFLPAQSGKPTMHALIKVPRKEWPNEELLKILRDIPPSFSIDVGPASLL